MEAILLVSGRLLRVYCLVAGGRGDVGDFLDSSRRPGEAEEKTAALGFLDIVDKIANQRGLDLPRGWYDRWTRKRGGQRIQVAELKKGSFRITCHRYPQGLLLVSVFRKTRQVQDDEYERAIRLRDRFDADPHWRER